MNLPLDDWIPTRHMGVTKFAPSGKHSFGSLAIGRVRVIASDSLAGFWPHF